MGADDTLDGCICRVGQNRIYTPYMTVYMVISLPKILYTHRIYVLLANPMHMQVEKNMTVRERQGRERGTMCVTFRVGQNHMCTVYILYFWQEITKYTVHIYSPGQPSYV